MPKPPRLTPGLIVLGSDTGVGKTFVAALIARQVHALGRKVGVYKPAASGCRREKGRLISDDALALWEAAGRPLTLAQVCPQRFLAPLAPHLAAEAEGKNIDSKKLRRGLEVWRNWADFLIVEGAGGVLSPLGEELIADLAADLDLPVLLVVPNRLGVVNQALQAQLAAQHHGLAVCGVVLNEVLPPEADDPSRDSNPVELRRRLSVPLVAHVGWRAHRVHPRVNWERLGGG